MRTSPSRHILALISWSMMLLVGVGVPICAAYPAHAALAQSGSKTFMQTVSNAVVARRSTVPLRPVLAFYYMWYHQSDWSLSKMSDLPTIQYDSSDDAT